MRDFVDISSATKRNLKGEWNDYSKFRRTLYRDLSKKQKSQNHTFSTINLSKVFLAIGILAILGLFMFQVIEVETLDPKPLSKISNLLSGAVSAPFQPQIVLDDEVLSKPEVIPDETTQLEIIEEPKEESSKEKQKEESIEKVQQESQGFSQIVEEPFMPVASVPDAQIQTCSGTASFETPGSATSSGGTAANAIDSNIGTFTIHFTSNSWIYFDLSTTKCVDRIRVHYGLAGTDPSVNIQVSDDASSWSTVNSTTLNNANWKTVYFNEVATRYVRVFFPTTFGLYVSEFEANTRTSSQSQAPNVTALIPVADSSIPIKPIEISANISDDGEIETTSANVSWVNSSGTQSQTLALVNLTYANKFNASFSPEYIPEAYTFYNVTFLANDTGFNTNDSEMTNFTVTDVTRPTVSDALPSSGREYTLEDSVNLSINVTDIGGTGIETVWAIVEYPDLSTDTLTMTTSGSSFYNASFVPAQEGTYTATFIVNDTSNNVNNSESTTFVAIPSGVFCNGSAAFTLPYTCTPGGVHNLGSNCTDAFDGDTATALINITAGANVTFDFGVTKCIDSVKIYRTLSNAGLVSVYTSYNGSLWTAVNTSFSESGASWNTIYFEEVASRYVRLEYPSGSSLYMYVGEFQGNIRGALNQPLGFSGGDTTDLAHVDDIGNIVNYTLHDVESGKIQFIENVNLSHVTDIDSFVNISFNRIFINSSGLEELNKSATLRMFNLTFDNPEVIVDLDDDGSFNICDEGTTPRCEVISYYSNNGSLIFNVSSFSTYSTQEGGNHAPNQTQPVLNSTLDTNLTSENLTCYPQSLSDSDGDAVWPIFNWYEDGVSTKVLNMPFEVNFTASDNSTAGVVDYSSLGNNGRLGNSASGTQPSWSSYNLMGGAYTFDGSNDWIEIPFSKDFDATGGITISAWVNATDDNAGAIASHFNIPFSPFEGWELGLGSVGDSGPDQLYFYLGEYGGGVDFYTTGDTGWTDGRWHLATITLNGTNISFYKDGAFLGIKDKIGTLNGNSTNLLYIGRDPNLGMGRAFSGTVGGLEIYNESLSGSQIYQLFLEGNNSLNISTIVSDETEIGDSWKCEVTPTDLEDAGNASNSSALTILGSDIPGENACGNLDSPNTVYTLTKHLNWGGPSSTSCINIHANNVTVDCAGYSINGTDAFLSSAINNTAGYDGSTIKNCVIRDFGYGINLNDLSGGNDISNSTIFNNTIISTTAGGIYGRFAKYSNITLNTLQNNYLGIHLTGTVSVPGTTNSVLGNVIEDSTFAGVQFGPSNNNTFLNNNISNSSNVGIWFTYHAHNNTFTNTLISVGEGDRYIEQQATYVSLGNNMANTTFSEEGGDIKFPETFSIPAQINVSKWTLNISSNRTFLNSSNLTFLNTSAELTIHDLEFTEPQAIVALDDSTFATCNSGTTPACNNVSYNGTTFVFNVSSFTTYSVQEALAVIDVNNCTNLTTSGTEYKLTQDVLNYNGSCMYIKANDVTLNCQGYTLDGRDDGSFFNYGITFDSHYNNTVIKNCMVKDFYGAFYSYRIMHNLTFINNTFTSNLVDCLTVSPSGLVSSDNISILNNNFTDCTTGNPAVQIYRGRDHKVINNSFYQNAGPGIRMWQTNHSVLENNTFYNNNVGISSNGALTLKETFYNNVNRNNITNIGSNSGTGIYLDGAEDNFFFHTTVANTNDQSANSYISSSNVNAPNNFTNTTFLHPNATVNFEFFSFNGTSVGIGNGYNSRANAINMSYDQIYLNSEDLDFLNTTATITFLGLTESEPQVYIDYADGGSFELCPSEVCENLSYVNGDFVFNVSHFTTFKTNITRIVQIDNCTNLTESNTEYILNRSIYSYNQTCMRINASGVTLNCQGRAIDGVDEFNNFFPGIVDYVGHNSTTITNCDIRDFNYGVYINGRPNNFTFTNNLLTSNVVGGVYISPSGDGAYFANNNMSNSQSGNPALQIVYGEGHRIINNTFAKNNDAALELWLANYSVVENNTFVDNNVGQAAAGAFTLDESFYTNVSRNNFSHSLSTSATLIKFDQAEDNLFFNNALFLTNDQASKTYISSSNVNAPNNFTNTTFLHPNATVNFEFFSFNGTSVGIGNGYNSRTNAINLSSNQVYVNSTALTFLNTTAEIKLYSLSFDEPQILADFADDGEFETCPSSICTNISYDGSTFVFNVTHFTTYKTKEANSPPTITRVSVNETTFSPIEGGKRSVEINFTVVDVEGVYDINVSSAVVNFSSPGEGLRENASCLNFTQSGSEANFTCIVDMFYFDGAGDWNVSVYVEDNSSEYGVNSSQNFTYQPLTAFILGPRNLSWSNIAAGASNQLADVNSTLNNTGNVDIANVSVKAYDLYGEQNSNYMIYAGNFTASNNSGALACSGTALANDTELNVTGAFLNAGNLSLNNGTAQEIISYCLVKVPEPLAKQAYTAGSFAWQIKTITLLAAFSLGRRKRRLSKKEETLLQELGVLRSRYGIGFKEIASLMKAEEVRELAVPVSIFNTKELGPAEALVKYLKEEVGLKLSEIADLTKRDDRTIWATYNHTLLKKERLSVKGEITIPISIFANRKLSILEGLVMFLQEKGLTNSEISRLSGKDQRNIGTLKVRIKKKLGR